MAKSPASKKSSRRKVTKGERIWVVGVRVEMYGAITVRAVDEVAARDRALDVLEYTMGDAAEFDPEDMTWETLEVYEQEDVLKTENPEAASWPKVWKEGDY